MAEVTSLLQWCKFHDLLPEDHAQKVPACVSGLVVQGQLYGRAVNLVAALPKTVITSPDGSYAIANSIHKVFPSSATTEAYQSFLSAICCVRGNTETSVNYEPGSKLLYAKKVPRVGQMSSCLKCFGHLCFCPMPELSTRV